MGAKSQCHVDVWAVGQSEHAERHILDTHSSLWIYLGPENCCQDLRDTIIIGTSAKVMAPPGESRKWLGERKVCKGHFRAHLLEAASGLKCRT